jgi:thiamine transport system substrate-binding protein
MRRYIVALLVAALTAAACGDGEESATTTGEAETTTTAGAEAADTLTLITHQSFLISDEVMAMFEQEHNVTVEILRADDAGAMLNQAILTKDNPLGDVLFGVDNTFLSRSLEAGIFEPYESPLLASVPDELELDPEHRVTPIDFGDVCLNYDRETITDDQAPQTLLDLTDERFRGQLVVENPATSSPGLAFLLATIAQFGEEGDYTWLDYWRDLRDLDVLVTKGWEDAYYGRFSGGSGEGDRPLVVSYASSPPAEVFYSDPQPEEAPTGAVEAGCFRQIEFSGVLAGTDAPDLAAAFIDFMLSVPFQEDIPLNMFVFPANSEAALPDVFVEHTTIPAAPATLDPEVIDANRDRWIEEWDDLMVP